MFNELQNDFDSSIRKMAEKNLIKKLSTQGIEKNDISAEKFNELLDLELDILKSDGKKVGTGLAVGIGISILTGGLF